MASATTPDTATATASSDDDLIPSLIRVRVNDDGIDNEDDDSDDLSLDGLEENDASDNPSLYTGTLCVVSSRRQWI